MASIYFQKVEPEYVRGGVFRCAFTVVQFGDLVPNNCSDQKCIFSSNFYTGNNRTIGWSLNLSFRQRCSDINESDNMILRIKSPASYYAQYTVGSERALYVMNNEGEEVELVNSLIDGDDGGPYGWDQYWFSRKHLIENRKVFLPDNNLRLICYVHVNLPMPPSKQIKISKQHKFIQFANFVENDEFSDVTIIVDEQEFRAHKIILSARSPVFAAMFRHEMKEKHENRVVIEDIDCETLKAMLQYIYTNEVTNIDDIVMDLLIVADKYELNDLKRLCEKTLSKYVTFNSAKKLLFMADRYNAELLVGYIKNFVRVINPSPVKYGPVGRHRYKMI